MGLSLATQWAPRGLSIFGRQLFTRATTQFQPVSTGPVDASYRLGPGDQILLVLTGDVELAHNLEVTREGTIIVPQVGQVVVQGLTVRELEDRIHASLSRVYSGVGRGPGATTQFSASLGRLRSNQVFLAGEVERPGAYLVSSVATVFSALYQARGPNPNGTYREIQVRRGPNLVRTVDVYDYLLRGDSRNDIRLEQGDIIFVPPAGRQVAIQGSVRRPAIYELKPGENLREFLSFAGGLDAAAAIGRIQIDRILPPEQRQPGVDRVLVDVELADFLRGAVVPLRDRDVIRVFSVHREQRNRVVVEGEVLRPGVFEWRPGTTLWQVIDRAEGLSTFAYTPRAHIYRLNPEDGTRFLLSAPLTPGEGGGPLADLPLADADSIVIYSRSELRNPRTVRIRGPVREPGTYVLAEGMTVRDLILAAGGFEDAADPTGVEIARRLDPAVRSDTLAVLSRVPLGGSAAGGAAPGGTSPTESVYWVPSDQDLVLVDRDQVIVRRAPGFEEPRAVYVMGEVITPGAFPLETRQVRLLDVLGRAGGPTTEADLNGLRIVREGLPVGVDYPRAVRRPRGQHNIVLEDGDSIFVPVRDPTVQVRGAVAFDARVLHVPGRTLSDYIAQAGGYTAEADRGRVSITYADGQRAIVRRRLFWRTSPPVEAGATIVVPAQAENREPTDWGSILSGTVSALGSLLTVWLAIDRLSR